MKKIAGIMGNVTVFIIKTVLWLILTTAKLFVEMAKVLLMIFGMVLRIFMAFVSAGTP